MIDIKKLKVDDVLIKKINGDKKRVKYIASNYIIVEDCKNGNPAIIIKDCFTLYTKCKKYIWTDWEEHILYFNDPFCCSHVIRIKCGVRSNGKRIQVRSGALSAMASCNEDYGDKFDFDKGVELAGKRLILKWLSYTLEAQFKE